MNGRSVPLTRSVIQAPPARLWLRAGTLFQCPHCGKQYPRAGQGHSCVAVPLDHHFRDRPPQIRELFTALCDAVERAGGPFRLSIAKTRIGLIARVTFAAVTTRKTHLRVGFLLRRAVKSRRFARIERIGRYWVHTIDIRTPADIDRRLRAWLGEAYQ